MSISDFISKTASDALGRIIAQAPDRFMSMFTSAAVVTVELSQSCYTPVLSLLTKIGTPVYRPISKYATEHSDSERFRMVGQSMLRASVSRNWECFIVKHRPVVLKTCVIDKTTYHFLSTLRGFDVDTFIHTALQEWQSTRAHAVYSYTPSRKDDTLLMDFTYMQKAPKYWRSPAVSVILNEIHNWMLSYAKCQERGLPWRRGWLLHGPPGNGKTQAVRLAAMIEKVNLTPINLGMMTDTHLIEIFKQLTVPCIVLIEDIDDIIRGRQNIKDPTEGVSFSTLLNCIDGVNSRDGVVVAVTTNDLAAIDPALGRPRDETHWNQLSTRPGRLDRCIRFDNPDLEGRIAIGKMLLDEAEAVALAHAHEDVSLVQFQAICREAAFAKLQDLDSLV